MGKVVNLKKLQRILLWMLGIISALVVLIIAFIIFVVVPRIEFKSNATHANAHVAAVAVINELMPEVQFESHTCGLHTLRIVYKAYGLNPDEENLRLRLGVDVSANPADSESTGTLHPDLYRVLIQDGFQYESLSLSDEASALDDMTQHLKKGNMAILLISRRENGNMHWVAASEIDNGNVKVIDSLFENPYSEQLADYMHKCILSCILVSKVEGRPPAQDLFTGADELVSVAFRMEEISKNRK